MNRVLPALAFRLTSFRESVNIVSVKESVCPTILIDCVDIYILLHIKTQHHP